MLIIGAHYDTVAATPGADDNASGVAALLGIARDLADETAFQNGQVRGVYAGRAAGIRTANMGSYHYARSLKEAGAEVEGMICLEMVGYFTDLPGSQSYPLPLVQAEVPFTRQFYRPGREYAFRTFTEDYRRRVCGEPWTCRS